MRLFVSYAHEDEALVEGLSDLLRLGGHDPWFDHRLLPGQDWKRQLLHAIRRCDVFVYTLTPASVESEWCQWEFAQAVRVGKPIIPILLKEGTPVPDVLRRYQYADFSKGATPQVVARLMGGLLNVAIMLAPTSAPKAPDDPRGLPALATREVRRTQVRGQRRRLWLTLGAIALAMLGAGYAVLGGPLGVAATATPTDTAATPSAVDYFGQGNAYRDLGDYDTALASYDAAIALDPQYIDAYLARANLHSILGSPEDHQQSLADYSQAIALDPANAVAYFGRGNVYYYGLGDLDSALADYTSAIDLNPDYLEAYLARASAYHDQGNADAAIADYSRAIEIDPAGVSAYYSRASLYYYALGDAAAALDDLARALELDSAYTDAYLLRGDIYAGLGDYEQALADYDAAIGLSPEHAPAYLSRALGHYTAYGNSDSAITDLQMAVALDPGYALAYLTLGSIFYDLQRPEEALRSYETYLSVESGEPDALAVERIAELQNSLGTPAP